VLARARPTRRLALEYSVQQRVLADLKRAARGRHRLTATYLALTAGGNHGGAVVSDDKVEQARLVVSGREREVEGQVSDHQVQQGELEQHR
jgi:hypothetical protein